MDPIPLQILEGKVTVCSWLW